MPSQTTRASWQLKSTPGLQQLQRPVACLLLGHLTTLVRLPLDPENISLKSCLTVGTSLAPR